MQCVSQENFKKIVILDEFATFLTWEQEGTKVQQSSLDAANTQQLFEVFELFFFQNADIIKKCDTFQYLCKLNFGQFELCFNVFMGVA